MQTQAVATRGEWSAAAALSAADWLSLAATPSFALMALVTGILGPRDGLCSALHDPTSLHGMVPMYLLMSAFHSPRWLKLVCGRRNGCADH